MTETQIAIEATKQAIISLVLVGYLDMQKKVESLTEEDIQPYMSSESTETE